MSFRIVQPHEQDTILAFIRQAPEVNLFMIGDIEFYVVSTDFLTVFVDDTPTLETVVLRYYRNLVVYSTTMRYPLSEIRQMIKDYNINFCNSGAQGADYLVSGIGDLVNVRRTTFARMLDDTHLDASTHVARHATLENVPAVVNSMAEISEFSHAVNKDNLATRIEHVKKKYQDGFSVAFIIEDEGKVIAHAEAPAMTSQAAMIVGVYTLAGYRGKGYASQVVSELCRYLLKQNKRPLLFFDNPDAAKIYHRLGFVDFDTWVMMPLKGDAQ